jgi:hypothetical protein
MERNLAFCGTYPRSTYRRRHNRYLVDAPATLLLGDTGERPSRVIDLSPGGAGVYADYPLAIDDKFNITIPPSYCFDDPFKGQARVVWCNKIHENLWRAGLAFAVENTPSFPSSLP